MDGLPLGAYAVHLLLLLLLMLRQRRRVLLLLLLWRHPADSGAQASAADVVDVLVVRRTRPEGPLG